MFKRVFGPARTARQRGIATIITGLALLVLIPIVGLAIDGGFAFVIKSRLSAAMDSAALAAGRGLNLADTIANAQAQATTQATNFFNANFPPGYMNTDPLAANRPLTPTFSVGQDANGNPTGVLTISITGSVLAPTYFMRWLGFNNLTISGTGTATRKNLVMELVLDKSASMGTRNTSPGTIPASINSGSSSCESMVYSTIQFTKYFSPYDYMGEISFDATVDDDFTSSNTWWQSGTGVAQKIANIQCGSNTNTTAALYKAYQDIKAANQVLAQNVIVLFTDGVPNAVNATFPVRNQVDSRLGTCSTGTGCGTSGSQTLFTNMPVCTATAGLTVTGVITQTQNFDVNSGSRAGPFQIISGDSTPTSVPAGCPTSGTSFTSQTVAYIPDSDYFGNSMHAFWDSQAGGWLYQVNSHTAPSGTPITSGNSATKNLGDWWSNYSTTGAGAPSNFFTSGPYSGYLRPDLANSIGVASMNSAMNMAATIRADTTFNITIDTVYLQGNGSDPVNRSFLQIVSNQKNIQPIIYDSTAAAYSNPYYQSTQQQGIWGATTSTLQLQSMFQQIASSLLRISQ
jgi:Flp pilus assembly protein TadG